MEKWIKKKRKGEKIKLREKIKNKRSNEWKKWKEGGGRQRKEKRKKREKNEMINEEA